MAKLLCLDFDNTIVNGHCHATLMNSGFIPRNNSNGVQTRVNGQFTNSLTGEVSTGLSRTQSGEELNNQKIQEVLMGQEVDGFKNGPQMCVAIKEALKNGNHVAITSFTLYPEVLLPALQMLRTPSGEGLTPQELNQICIVGGFPKAGPNSPQCKQEHIQAAMQHFGITHAANVMLVDDSTQNIAKAGQSGMQTQVVPKVHNPNDSYFGSINQFVKVGPTLQAQNVNIANQQPEPVMQRTQGEQYVKLPQANTPVASSRPLTAQPPPFRLPTPLTANQVQQLLPQNPALDKILNHSLQELMTQYENNKAAVHQADGKMTSLFNRVKSTVHHISGTSNERINQIASIVNVFAALKSDPYTSADEKAAIAYAHLETVKTAGANSSGMRQLCVQLQSKIKDEYPNVVEKGVKPEFKQQAKAFANPQPSKVENEKKLR